VSLAPPGPLPRLRAEAGTPAPASDVSLAPPGRQLRLRAEAETPAPPGEVSVTVSDRGAGIPTADLPKVFTKFFRRSEGRPNGSGLGLWISRGLVEAHGGVLTAESIATQGTAFRFTLPLTGPEDLRRP
jgi:signal transduction histidine kinase